MFTIQSLCESNTARARRIPNIPANPEHEKNLVNVIKNILEPIENSWGPIRVNSGYRCPKLNAAIGGAKNSQHCNGEAVDITTGNLAQNKRLLQHIINMGKSGQLVYDQLINEYPQQGCPKWIHISYTTRRPNRMQMIKIG